MRRIGFVLLFWLIAAGCVVLTHSVVLQALGIVGTAAIFMLCAKCDFHFALAAGVAWLVLDIVAEIVTTAVTGHNGYALLGAPDHIGVHYALLFLWVAAPALFARVRS